MPAKKPLITKSAIRLHFLCLFFALGSFVWGYNVGILASVLVHPGFVKQLGSPDASRKGIITAIYYLGTWTSYVFISRVASDKFGRRYAALAGTAVTCFGTALIAGATGSVNSSFAMVISGRIIAGVGVAIVSTSVPLYQSEISPAKERGKFVVMNHIGFVFGLASGFWVGYGMTFWDSAFGLTNGWRISIILQFVPAAIFAAGLPFLPETPRWLVEHNKFEQAHHSLAYLREGSFSPPQITQEFNEIKSSVAAHHASGENWLSLFKKPNLFARLWRAALLQFMAQMCGATAMKYYLPDLFKVLGFGTRLSLLAGGIESTLKIGCTIIEMLIIDRAGRKLTLAVGAATMAFAMLINGILPQVFPNNINRPADYVCVIFIFIYTFGYGIGFGPSAWVYGSEIFPQSLRARGLNFSASGGAIGSIIVTQVWPIGIANLGSKIYFFFMAINLVSVPIIWVFYPETKGVSLENMDALFGVAPPAPHPVDEQYEDLDYPEDSPPKHVSRPGNSETFRLV